MSNPPVHPVSPPPVPTSPPTTGVRRHHTISASSRAAHTSSRLGVSDDSQQPWNDDEVVDQDWEGGIGAVGDKGSSLHRQSSLPTRYNRAFQRSSQAARQPGTLTPRTMNSLTAITAEHGHEGEEEEWEREMRGWRNNNEESGAPSPDASIGHGDGQSQGSSHSPLSPHFAVAHNVPSPPPAGSNIRRHQSLTYGAAGGTVRRVAANLKRSGTLQAQIERPGASAHSPSPPSNDEELVEEEGHADEEFYYPIQQQQQQQGQGQGQGHGQGQYSTMARVPWGTQDTDWRAPAVNNLAGNGASAIDDVQRALSALELSSSHQSHFVPNQGYQPGAAGAQVLHAPRFNHGVPQQQPQVPGMRRDGNGSNGGNGNGNGGASMVPRSSGKLQLVTDFDGKVVVQGPGPASASAAVPPIGHGAPLQQPIPPPRGVRERDDHALTASGTWDQKERVLSLRSSNSNMQYTTGYGGIPPNPPVPAQYLSQQAGLAPRLGVASPFGQNVSAGMQGTMGVGGVQQGPGFLTSPVDVPTLIATKGYNPAEFDIRPAFARYFVIKSYTEDDVHKSLKYEIWSSTDPGNKRLDKAFKETSNRGPIYLFFSVNASGHFCGMAEMLTPVDYTRSSTVWASDKWKGVFKVRWIFVRDIPNANLRHIRLNNTQERKPVTNSRDTQELLPDAGQEMLRIFFTHPARTSLLQDFAFYELQSMQKIQQQQQPTSPLQSALNIQSPQPQLSSQNQQHPFALPNSSPLAYSTQHLSMPPPMGPMMQMQMNSQYSHPHTIQSVMRNSSPIPSAPSYMGMNSGF